MDENGDLPAAGHPGPETMLRLRLLATTDLHMQLTAYDHGADRPDPGLGLTRVATLIAAARAEAEQAGALCLLFDNGDALQGGPFGELAARHAGRAHPMMRAFAHLRYDALGLGNHDFDLGLDRLAVVLAQAPCPVVCTNLRLTDGGAGFVAVTMLDRAAGPGRAVRIGVMSFLPPQTAIWNAHHLGGRAEAQDILSAARATLPGLRDAGCDVVVALAHSGPGVARPPPGAENAARALARMPGIDAVIAGHTHQVVISAAGDPPLVMAGASGSHLGIIDLDLAAEPAGGWRVTSGRAALRPVAARGSDGVLRALADEDSDLAALLAEDHAEARALMAMPVGQTDTPLHSYFTLFAPDRALALVAAAQAAALRPVLAGRPEASLPLLSAVAPGRFGARAGPGSYVDIPAGPVTLRHLIDLQVFPNDLHAVVVSGAQLADWIEQSTRLFHTITPGSADQSLLDQDLPGHDFDVIHGVTCAIDLASGPRFRPDGHLRDSRARRVRDLRHLGKPVDPDARFVVALSSYRSAGGGNFAALKDATRLTLPHIGIRSALGDYLSGRAPHDPLQDAPAPWRFVPMPGTRVIVQTGPGALAHMADLDARGVEPAGFDADGFLRLLLPL